MNRRRILTTAPQQVNTQPRPIIARMKVRTDEAMLKGLPAQIRAEHRDIIIAIVKSITESKVLPRQKLEAYLEALSNNATLVEAYGEEIRTVRASLQIVLNTDWKKLAAFVDEHWILKPIFNSI